MLLFLRASAPTATFPPPVVLFLPEPSPIAVFPTPVVVLINEAFPTAVFSAPAPVCAPKASLPTAVLKEPVVFASNAP